MPRSNNIKDRQNAHSHGAVSRGLQKKRKDISGKKVKSKKEQPTCEAPAAAAPSSSLESDARVLILGEGNFAFAAALALDWGACPKLTATTNCSKASTLADDAEAEDNLETVKAFGGSVLFRVDATELHASEEVVRRGGKGYGRIVFNFPLAVECGSGSGSGAQSGAQQAIDPNQKLLRGVFKSILRSRLLCESSGELHLTLSASTAAEWKLLEMARIAGLRVKSCCPFDETRYHGYAAPAASARDAVTYVLVEVPPKVSKEEAQEMAVAKLRKERPDLRIGPTGQSYKEAWKQRHRNKA